MPGRHDLVTRRELLERTLGTAAALADAKLIKSSSQQIIAQGSDFAYMRQLRSELTH